jgi:hypothetical protein
MYTPAAAAAAAAAATNQCRDDQQGLVCATQGVAHLWVSTKRQEAARYSSTTQLNVDRHKLSRQA